MILSNKHSLDTNGSRLCFVAEKKAKTLDLKIKLTNTNQTSNYARYRNRAKPML